VLYVLLKQSVWRSATALVAPCADLRLADRVLYLVWILATALAVRRADLPATDRVLLPHLLTSPHLLKRLPQFSCPE
jgi:hypothetical protein